MTTSTRTEIEDFLYLEASLLDEWRLEEWVELFTLDCTYEVPATDAPEADPALSWSLIHDRRTMLEQRVIRLKKPEAHAEFPHSRTSRIIGNVRILEQREDSLEVSASFLVSRMKAGKFDQYAGHYFYELVPGLKIRRKKAVLAHDCLDPQGKISFVL
ncbi:aromatic-ring-hydroxylating dioxygenase subunit beta [Amycolatopsis acidiphila]|uniref:Aromatic-ring-hydroxylating dioxygenase subunit beta n=1 Tax=Amycolatopsis acidiphila TaxID=715473 RepID=A0A558AL94_9PSEU|nr:aromatic-ring-hydroxylating dioxygenase subunit beta [Amycolatopsis acidiphila]TVT25023.1 aromatic-ring-hydroxylating dioxygenase subunit beta [Amycolatopsis acidiphila]UIJ57468.1 aromatic-ring-hydroxylating dioxygenase subunit beta [Amycolatopsis acidiphila]GHG96258.1 aromatic-ring-hydroxylating dioxygenase subunit beta [Amycolatopsis acidiphila]